MRPERPLRWIRPPAFFALCAALSGCAGDGGRLPAPGNLLLLTVDTLRADHLSAYGYERPTSPVLERLAAEGVLFTAAAVQWPKTAPSFASLFTATYPKDNEIVRKVGIRLPLEFRMLAEELRAHGYGTHAVVANGALGSDFNFHQGFDTYVEAWKETPESPGEDPAGAASVTRLASEVVERLDPERPFFLWVHYLDPHFPYDPPPPHRDRFVGDAWYDPEPALTVDEERPRKEMGGVGHEQVLEGKTELAHYVARYDEEIAYADAEIGRLLDLMERRGLLGRTLTVFTSDHGESLGEHRYFFDHGRFGFQTCLHVPLVVRYPGVVRPGVDRRPVELIHLAPTLLEAAGVELQEGTWRQGRSLVPRLLGRDDPETTRYAFSEAGYATRRRWQKIVRDERYKLTFTPYTPSQRWVGGRGVEYTLHDLDADPAEGENLLSERPEDFRRLKGALYAWYRPAEVDLRTDPPGPEGGDGEMDEETRRQLKALGYLD